MQQPNDPRQAIYDDLHKVRLTEDKERSINSARYIFTKAKEYFPISSVLDIGCGLGTYLSVAQQMGIEIAGVEGPWCEVDKLDIDKRFVTITDLEKPIELGRRFDVAISLEVGEHLSDAAAPHLVKALTSHADHVIFSAAIPFQGGMHHINEQFLGYWAIKFAQEGFLLLDIFRGPIWMDVNIHVWLRQNLMLFVKQSVLESNPKLKAESLVVRPLDIVHPQFYVDKLLEARGAMATLQQTLLQDGLAHLRQTPKGPIFELKPPQR